MVMLDRRISRYSLKRLTSDDVSLIDKILVRYKKLINRFYKNKFLKKISLRYDKYLYGTDSSNAMIFVINKLCSNVAGVHFNAYLQSFFLKIIKTFVINS